MQRSYAGFTWIELLLVVAVLGIIAAMAFPGMQDNVLRKQVKDGLALADLAKAAVQQAWSTTGEMPADNAAAGIPPKDKIVGNVVKEVEVDAGAITITYGNNASRAIEGLHVTLRPAIVPGQPVVPIAWLCHEVPVPANMELKGGPNRTDVPPSRLPVECRGSAPK